MLLLRIELIQVTDDGSYISNFKMEEGSITTDEVAESLMIMETRLENFMRRRMGHGGNL